MQSLARLSVLRPVFAAVVVLALAALGLFSVPTLGIERYPNVDVPYVIVTTVVPGASAREIETDVTEIIERQVNTVSGIESLTSTSYDGYSLVTIQFRLERDGDAASQEVRAQIDQALPDLPKVAERPVVAKFRTDDIPIIAFTLSAPNVSIRDLTEYAKRRLLPQLQGLPGVGDIALVGGRSRQIQVQPDPARLAAFDLTVADIRNALESQNAPVPGGALERERDRAALRTTGRAASLDELAGITVKKAKPDDGGRVVRLADVANVSDSEAAPTTLARVNGSPAVLLNVRKQSGANTVAVAESVRDRLREIAPTLPKGYRTEIVRDEAVFVSAAVHDVQTHLILGSVLAALVVLVFLRDLRSAVIAALAIPASIIATFAVMRAQGFTLNTLTLLALTLAVGIVIDDAILVLENITRFLQEKRLPPQEAAIEATREIGLAVLATTLSLVAVFLPVALIPGLVGRFLRSFGMTMSAAILLSLVVAFTLTPMLCSRWLKPKEHDDKESDTRHRRDWLTPLEDAYATLLRTALRPGKRWITIVAVLATVASTIPLGAIVNKGFLPQDDQSQFSIAVRASEGTSLGETERVLERIAGDVRGLPDVIGTVVTVGEQATNRGTILVRMPEKKERRTGQTQNALMERVSKQVLTVRFPDLDALVVTADSFSSGGAAVVYVLTGPERESLVKAADAVVASVRNAPGVAYARTTAYTGSPEIQAQVDRVRAADLGVSVADVALTLRTLSAGEEVTRYAENGRLYDVVIRTHPDLRRDADTLAPFAVAATESATGVVPLSQVVTFALASGVSEISRYARQNEVRVLVNPTPGASTEEIQQRIERAVAAQRLPADVQEFWEGDAKEMERTFSGFAVAFGLSLVFMYLILAAQFESWVHPITILISLPLCVPFALLPIVLTGDSLNLFSLLGLLVLFGIVKKNAILQVDHANQLRAEGLPRDEAIARASRDRLRPILMTTIAFVAGMVPLALSREAGAETNRSISVTVIGGQTLSLALTLIATPVFYALFDDLSQTIGRLRERFGRKTAKTAGSAVLVLLFLLPLALPAHGQTSEPMTVITSVDEAVALALRINPEVSIAAERRKRAALTTRQLQAGLREPQAFASLSYTRLSNPNAFGVSGGTNTTGQSITLSPLGGSLTTAAPGEPTRSRQTVPGSDSGGIPSIISPTIDLNVSTAQAGVILPMDITGSLRAGVRAGRLDEEIATLEQERTARDLALVVRTAAYDLLRTESLVAVREAALLRAREQLRLTNLRRAEGLVSEFDVLRTATEEKAARQEIVSARTAADTARSTLANRIGVLLGDIRFVFNASSPAIPPPPSESELDIETLFARAANARAEANIANRTTNRARAAARFAARTGEPSLSFSLGGTYQGNQAGFGFGGSTRRDTGTASVALTFPLWDGGATRAAVASARSEEREASVRRGQYLRGIRAEIEQAVLAVRDAYGRKTVADEAVIEARRAQEIAQVRYSGGVGTRLETLDAQAALTRADADATSAAYDCLIARARLSRAIGG